MNIEMCSNAVESHDEPMGASKEGTETFLQQSMIVARHAARSVFEECRDRLRKTRYLNHRQNNANGKSARRLYLVLSIPDGDLSPPSIGWMLRRPKFSGLLGDSDDVDTCIAEDIAFGHSDTQLGSLARPFELDAVLAIEKELIRFRRYCHKVADLCVEATRR